MNDKGLFEISKADARVARLTLSMVTDELSINIAAYHTQQAIEKMMKFTLNLSGFTYPSTHNLSLLIDYATENGITFPSWIADITFLLNAWATQTRYNASFTAAKRDVEKILTAYEIWCQEIEKTLSQG